MTFLADVNVLVDVALDRRPWSLDAKALLDAAAARDVDVFVASTTIKTLFYLVRNEAGAASAYQATDRAITDFLVAAVGVGELRAARAMPGRDFEDNVQIACAMTAGVDRIVTRNLADFRHSPVLAVSSTDMLALLPPLP